MASTNSTSTDSPNATGEKAFADDRTNPDMGRKPQVGEPVTSSFDERTGVTQPFVMSDGSQDNGAPKPEDVDGASRRTTREGESTTVEDTNVAIKEGTVEGPQHLGSEEAQEPPKNPVAEESNTGAADNVSTQETGRNTKPARSTRR